MGGFDYVEFSSLTQRIVNCNRGKLQSNIKLLLQSHSYTIISLPALLLPVTIDSPVGAEHSYHNLEILQPS